MDCRTAKENIDLYIDGLMDAAQSEELMAHIASCQSCKKAIDDSIRLKKALALLGEVEPPQGLASGAVRKARKRHVVPIAFISSAAAAVLALIVILTSGILPQASNDSAKSTVSIMAAAPAEDADTGAGSTDMKAAAEAPMADQAPAAAESTPPMEGGIETQRSEMTATGSNEAAALPSEQEEMFAMEAPAPVCVIYVPDDHKTEVRAALENIIAKYEIEATYEDLGDTETISFILPEAALEEVSALIAEVPPEGEMTVDQLITFTFNK